MKKATIFPFFFFCTLAMSAQTLNVKMGEVTYAHSSSNTGDMTFANGTTVTIEGKTYTISEIDNIVINNNSVADNTVSVTYNGSSADVVVAGNVAKYLTVTASGATVSIIQDTSLADEITYTLTGTSTNGCRPHFGSPCRRRG